MWRRWEEIAFFIECQCSTRLMAKWRHIFLQYYSKLCSRRNGKGHSAPWFTQTDISINEDGYAEQMRWHTHANMRDESRLLPGLGHLFWCLNNMFLSVCWREVSTVFWRAGVFSSSLDRRSTDIFLSSKSRLDGRVKNEEKNHRIGGVDRENGFVHPQNWHE